MTDLYGNGETIAAKNAESSVWQRSAETRCHGRAEPRCGVCWAGESWEPVQRPRLGWTDGPNERTAP